MEIETLANTSRVSRAAVAGALLLIGGAALYNWMVTPYTHQLQASQQLRETLNDVSREAQSLKNITTGRKKKLNEMLTSLGSLKDAFFTPRLAKEFLSDLQAVSAEEDCTVFSISIDQKSAGSRKQHDNNEITGIQTHTATLGVLGSYSDVGALLRRLQTRTQKVHFNGIDIEPIETDPSQLKCIVELTIYALQGEEDESDG